ncbi:MAG: DUF4184 family protein [Thermoplasmata archaeon]
MALIAFHCALVWPLFIPRPKRFNFIGLSAGAVIPDLLLPFMTFLPSYAAAERVVSHSHIGAFTFDLMLALLAPQLIVPRIISYFRRHSSDPRAFRSAGIDVLEQRGRLPVVTYSILMGTTSHVILDILYHASTPVLYPLPNVIFSLEGVLPYEVAAHGAISLAFTFPAYKYWWKAHDDV